MQTQAGRFRHRVTIQSVTRTRVAGGQPIATTTDVETNVPANVVSASGSEGVRSSQVSATATHLIFMRYRDGVTPQHQIVWRGRTFGIISARDADNSRRLLTISCQEAV